MSTQETPAAPVNTPPQNQQPEAATSTSGSAIAGFVLGIMAFMTLGITSIPGIIFSAVGMSRCSRSNGKVTGYGLAIAGLVLSIVGFFISFVFMAMLAGPLMNARNAALHVASTNNMKQIGAACRQYEQMKGQAPADLEALSAAELFENDKTITNPLTEQKDYIFLPYEAKSNGARIILVEAPGANESSIGALFYDGHVKMLNITGKEAQEKFVQSLQNNDREQLLKWREKIEDPFYIKGDK